MQNQEAVEAVRPRHSSPPVAKLRMKGPEKPRKCSIY